MEREPPKLTVAAPRWPVREHPADRTDGLVCPGRAHRSGHPGRSAELLLPVARDIRDAGALVHVHAGPGRGREGACASANQGEAERRDRATRPSPERARNPG